MCAPPGLFADTALVRYVESTTYKMEETPCHHQGRLPKGRHSLGALERRVGPPAAMWRGPRRGRPYRFEPPIRTNGGQADSRYPAACAWSETGCAYEQSRNVL